MGLRHPVTLTRAPFLVISHHNTRAHSHPGPPHTLARHTHRTPTHVRALFRQNAFCRRENTHRVVIIPIDTTDSKHCAKRQSTVDGCHDDIPMSMMTKLQ